MIQELDPVVLACDKEEHELKKGDIGTVVYIYKDAVAFEVEFVTGDGETIAVLTLLPADVRAMQRQEIMHVRELIPA